MRTVTTILLIASLALIFVQCGDKEPTYDAWAAMEKNKFVRIATDPVNVPFESSFGVDLQGYDVDLGLEIAKDLGYPVRWIPIMEFDRIFGVLNEGAVEMIISTVAITPERQKEYAFSKPYFDSANTIAHRIDNPAIKDLASLSGKNVGVQNQRTGDIFMTSQTTAANVTVTRFPTLDDALGALNRGEIDAVVGDEPIITYSIYQSFATNLITTDVQLTKIQYAVAVRPQETKLLEKINETITRLQNTGELEKLREKWFQNVMEDTKKKIVEQDKLEQLKVASKRITLSIRKQAGSKRDMGEMDGFSFTLSGDGGSFPSSPILTDDAGSGRVSFPSPIPPGNYTLSLGRIGMRAPLTIPKTAVDAMTFNVIFLASGGVDIVPVK